jgi:hydroxypyruvate isomerase
MKRFSAKLSFFRQDLLFLDHCAAAARDGFDTLRQLGPLPPEPKERLADALKARGLKQVSLNAPSGGRTGGDEPGISLALDYAAARCIDDGIGLPIEPIHLRDAYGLFLSTTRHAECPCG